jgi:plasminogen activator inhibitor 1 RNA-binding protein
MANRFAALAPDYEEEEAQKKKEKDLKAKKEAQIKKKEEKAMQKPTVQAETKGFTVSEGQTSPETSRFRGARRGPRGGRGTFSRGTDFYQVKEGKTRGDHHYPGSNDPVHPYDRHSGSGRGTEISKRGRGRRNWGTPEEDIKNQEQFVEEHEEERKILEAPIEEAKNLEEKKVEEKKEEAAKPISKREKKLRKKGMKKEEKKEENLDEDGTALTYKEYQAKMAEKQTPIAKLPEPKLDVDTKKTAGLVSYEKKYYTAAEEKQMAEKKKKEIEEAEETEAKPEVLGTFIGQEKRERKGRKYEDAYSKNIEKEGQGIKKKEDLPQKEAFVLKDEDFPTFKKI